MIGPSDLRSANVCVCMQTLVILVYTFIVGLDDRTIRSEVRQCVCPTYFNWPLNELNNLNQVDLFAALENYKPGDVVTVTFKRLSPVHPTPYTLHPTPYTLSPGDVVTVTVHPTECFLGCAREFVG